MKNVSREVFPKLETIKNSLTPIIPSSNRMQAIRFARISISQKGDKKLRKVIQKGYKIIRLKSNDHITDHLFRRPTTRACFKFVMKINLQISLDAMQAWLIKLFRETRKVSIKLKLRSDSLSYTWFDYLPLSLPVHSETFCGFEKLIDHYLPKKLNYFSFQADEFQYIDRILRKRFVETLYFKSWFQEKFKKRALNYFLHVKQFFFKTNSYIPMQQISRNSLTHLTIVINTPNGESKECFSQIKEAKRLTNLTYLTLEYAEINERGIPLNQYIEPFLTIKSLKHLRLINYHEMSGFNLIRRITESCTLALMELLAGNYRWTCSSEILKNLASYQKKLINTKLKLDCKYKDLDLSREIYNTLGASFSELSFLTSLYLSLPLSSHRYCEEVLQGIAKLKSITCLSFMIYINPSSKQQCQYILAIVKNNKLKNLDIVINVTEFGNTKDYIEFDFFEELLYAIIEQTGLLSLRVWLGKLKKRKKATSLEEAWGKLPLALPLLQKLHLILEGQEYFFIGELYPLFLGLEKLKYLRELTVCLQSLYPTHREIDKIFDCCRGYKFLSLDKFEFSLNDQKYSRKMKELIYSQELYHRNNLIYE
jgi:hypothetical protein